MSEQKIPIPAMLYNAAVGGHVTNSQQIIDENENKEQSQINAEVKQTIGQGGFVDERINQAKTDIIGGASSNGNTLKKVEDRVSPLELAVGSGGSVDTRIAAAKSEIKGDATPACDTLGEAEALISAEKTRAQSEEENLRTLYNNLQQSQPIPVTSLPVTGEAGKIYRLAGTTSYADYMYNSSDLTTPVKMAEYDNAIDDNPTPNSDNLVKSGGVANARMEIEEGYNIANIKGANGSYNICNKHIGVIKGKSYKISISGNITPYPSAPVYALRVALVKLDGSSGGVVYNLAPSETFVNTVIEYTAPNSGYLQIDGQLTNSSVGTVVVEDTNEAKINRALDLVSKPKDLDITWQNYGILVSGVQGTSDTFKHAEILLNKGDIVKVISNIVSSSYASISLVLGENSYKPLLAFRSDWTTFEYIVPETGTYAITGRYNSSNIITVQCISSETFSYIDDKIINVNRILGNRTKYIGSPNKATPIPIEWESGQVAANGNFQAKPERIRTKDYILIDNLVLLRVKSSVKYWVCLYDENYVAISGTSTDKRIAYNANVDAAIVLNTLVWKYKQYKPKYAIIFIDTTDSSVINVSGDTLQAVLNNRRILSSRTVKCAAHQGIQMHIQQDGLERSFGANMLSSFWGAYLCGFDMNLVNHLFTSDGVPVCAHDDQVTDDDGNVITISNLTLSELNTHTFGGETIPTLDSVIYLSKMLGMEVFLVNVDVLSGEDAKLNAVLSIIDKYRMWKYTWLMCSGNTLTSVLSHNSKARVAICQNPVSSSDVNDAIAAVETAESVMTDNNEVMVWLNGEHDPSSLETVALAANPKLKIGCYNIGTSDSNYDTKLVARLPYLDVYSSHYSSYGASLRNIELSVAATYPTIIAWQNGNII